MEILHHDSDEQFVSEAVTPWRGSADASAMARGEPGLPKGFDWRGQPYRVEKLLATWKTSAKEGGTGELYLRRHWYRAITDPPAEVVLYCLRQARPGRRRWFLYTYRPLQYPEQG